MTNTDLYQADTCKFNLNFTSLASLSYNPKFGPTSLLEKQERRRSSRNVWLRLLGDRHKPVSSASGTAQHKLPCKTPHLLPQGVVAKLEMESFCSSACSSTSGEKEKRRKLSLEDSSEHDLLRSNAEESPPRSRSPRLISESTSRLNQMVEMALDVCEAKVTSEPPTPPQPAVAPHSSKFAIFGSLRSDLEAETQRAEQFNELFSLLSDLSFDKCQHAVAEKPAEIHPAVEPVRLESQPASVTPSRRQLEKLWVEQLLSPSPRALSDLNRRLASYKAEAQRQVQLRGSKIEQNIQLAKDYRRVAKLRTDGVHKDRSHAEIPRFPPGARLRPSTTQGVLVLDPLAAVAWHALILAARFPDLLQHKAGGIPFLC
eukprot:GGOE01001751.1.p1 GENE.GGOE01001751.1~~GGOE01001751.1.p1  ORF type:complete len:397 (+),score=31.55 GGOE01001751.1:78-1193(+)